MSIWFNCKKCGEALEAKENKSGALVSCPKCQSKIRIPGIAMQEQVTKEQIEYMRKVLKLHWQALITYLVLLMINIFLIFVSPLRSIITSSPSLKYIMPIVAIGGIASAFWLLGNMSKSRKYLGVDKVTDVFLFVALHPVWIILCITSYLKFKGRVAALQKVGIRGNVEGENSQDLNGSIKKTEGTIRGKICRILMISGAIPGFAIGIAMALFKYPKQSFILYIYIFQGVIGTFGIFSLGLMRQMMQTYKASVLEKILAYLSFVVAVGIVMACYFLILSIFK